MRNYSAHHLLLRKRSDRVLEKVKSFAKPPDSSGIAHRSTPLNCTVSHSTLSSESKPTLAKVLSGVCFDYPRPLFHHGGRFRLCLDNVRELSASTRGSALVFQGVGESHCKMLGRKNPGSSVTVCFPAPFAPGFTDAGDDRRRVSKQLITAVGFISLFECQAFAGGHRRPLKFFYTIQV